jgi:hypothetical protein
LNALQFLFTPEGAAAQTTDEQGSRRRRKNPKVPPTTYGAYNIQRIQPATHTTYGACNLQRSSKVVGGAGSERSATEAAGSGVCPCLT